MAPAVWRVQRVERLKPGARPLSRRLRPSPSVRATPDRTPPEGGPHHREPSTRVVSVEEVWVEQLIDAGTRGGCWTAAFRLIRSRGRVRVGEARIFPQERGRAVGGDWSGCWRGLDVDVPSRGITRTILKRADPHHWLSLLAERVSQSSELARMLVSGELERSAVSQRPGLSLKGRAGRRPHSDDFLARVAQEYARAASDGRTPVQTVAERHGDTVAKVRGWIHQARVRGFLEHAAQGRGGGRITPKTQKLLDRARNSRTR
jgi:transposase-like protein